jgi:hypothetical protein
LAIARDIDDRKVKATGCGISVRGWTNSADALRRFQFAEQSLSIYEQIENPNAAKVRAQLAEWREEAGYD